MLIDSDLHLIKIVLYWCRDESDKNKFWLIERFSSEK